MNRQAIYKRITTSDKRAKEYARVKELVEYQRMKMPRLGTRKLHYQLKEILSQEQIKIGRDGLFKLLRAESMLIKPKRNYMKTTHSKHWLRKHPNLLLGKTLTRSNEVYVSDITYIKSRERTHYLSLVTDAYSRKIVGYHLSDDMSAEEVVKAIKQAAKGKTFNSPIIHHSDRGLQYCSAIYQNELNKNRITPSMTEGYDCYQNALAERINGILKNEFLIHKCNNGKELKQYIKQSIETYNNLRPHLSLNMKTPEYIHKKSREENLTALI